MTPNNLKNGSLEIRKATFYRHAHMRCSRPSITPLSLFMGDKAGYCGLSLAKVYRERSLIFLSILSSGDEIIALNGRSFQDASHDEAINGFRAIKNGKVVLHFLRREGSEKAR